MAERLHIQQWAKEDRPREKLLAKGPRALSDAELLAILIGSGTIEEDAVSLMRRILADCKGSLQTLGTLPLEELTAYKGVGPAKAVTIMAACELGRRRMYEPVVRQTITCSKDIADYFRPMLQDLSHEECHVMLLRQNLTLKDVALIGRGGLTEAVVDIRLILEQALRKQAAVIALCHNHPSGSLRPSMMDNQLTKRLNDACRIMGIKLLDHLIVSSMGYYSYNDEGHLE